MGYEYININLQESCNKLTIQSYHINMYQCIVFIHHKIGLFIFKHFVPIKSNIQIIQTDTPFVILRKHPRFSILQKDENTMNKQLKTKYTFFPLHENATSTKHKLQTQRK